MPKAKIKIQKTCEWCGKIYYAFNVRGKFCSHDCSTRARLARIRSERAEKSGQTLETMERYTGTVTRHYLTVSDTARLLGVSRPTVYSYLNQRILMPILLGKRMYIRKEDLVDKVHTYATRKISPKVLAGLENEVYTTEEVSAKFGISTDWIRKKAKLLGITPIKFRKQNLWDKHLVDERFKQYDEYPEIKDWASADELVGITGWKRVSAMHFCSKHKIPRKHIGSGCFHYSLEHFKKALGIHEGVKPSYYYVKEVMEKYQLTREQVYAYKKYYRITAIYEGVRMKLSVAEVDKVLASVHQRD